MTWRIGVVVLVALATASTGLRSQQPQTPGTLSAPPAREPSWAFQIQNGSLPDEPPGPRTLEGSTRSFTPAEIDDLRNPPDWFPDAHPPAPSIVRTGHGDAMACGSCHLMSGLGHPESADVSGQTADYLERQLLDFRTGVRIDNARMNQIAKALSDEEIREAAAWFASLPRQTWVRVVEAAMVPKTFVGQGRMRFVDPAGGMEPIGERLITLPESQERARMRDPRSGFMVYAPPGSLARGKALVEGGDGRTIACAICHGQGMQGLANVPRLAGLHPIYIARQLYLFREGDRTGADAPLMRKPLANMNDRDILDVSAYLGSLPPQ